MLSLPSLSRRRSSYCSRKPTANQPHCDHGNVSDTSWYLLGVVGKVVFEILKQLPLPLGKTLIMAIYFNTTVTGVVVFWHPDRGDSTKLLGRKLFSPEKKGKLNGKYNIYEVKDTLLKRNSINVILSFSAVTVLVVVLL